MRLGGGVLVVALGCAAGCSKSAPDSKGSEAQGASEPELATVGVATDRTDLSFLAPDTMLAVGMDLSLAIDGKSVLELWSPNLEMLGCSPEVVRKLQHATVGFGDFTAPGATLAVVRIRVVGTFDRRDVVACAGALEELAGGVHVEQRPGGLSFVDAGGKEVTALHWIDGGFVVAPSGATLVGAGPGDELKPLLNELNLNSSWWFVGQMGFAARGVIDQMWLQLQAGEEFRLSGAIKYATQSQAARGDVFGTTLANMLAKRGLQVEPQTIDDRVEVTTEGVWVHFEAKLSVEEFRAFLVSRAR